MPIINILKEEGLKYPPIELVDGEKLVELFEQYNLGLKPKSIYEILQNFRFDLYCFFSVIRKVF